MRPVCAGLAVGLALLAGCSRMIPPPILVPPPPSAPSTTVPATPEQHGPTLRQIAIPVPAVVTGLPGPTVCRALGKLPDPHCTPGSVNPAVTQATINTTICSQGWTATVRPSSANTTPVKTRSMIAYGIVPSARAITELDHLVPLELGGSDDTTNLWAELSDLPGHGFTNTKDPVESALKTAVCGHKVPLAAAQSAIATNWTTARIKFGL